MGNVNSARKNCLPHIGDLVRLGRERFTYDPETGELFWRDPGPQAFDTLKGYRIFRFKFAGKRAGFVSKTDGYVRVFVLGKSILAHRLIWAMVHGYDPADDIDHRDLCRRNNRLSNLREATRSQNCMNKGLRSNNKSGVKGVHWHRATQKWAAAIMAKDTGKIHLGVFSTREEAARAYEAAAVELHGDFAKDIAA